MYPDLLERCGLSLHKMVLNDCTLIFLTSFLCWSVSNSNSSSKCNFTHVTKSFCSTLNRGSCFSIRISHRLGRQIQAVQKVHAKWTKWAQPSDLCLYCGFLTIKEMSASTECHEWAKKGQGGQRQHSTHSKMPIFNIAVRNQNAPYNWYTHEM